MKKSVNVETLTLLAKWTKFQNIWLHLKKTFQISLQAMQRYPNCEE